MHFIVKNLLFCTDLRNCVESIEDNLLEFINDCIKAVWSNSEENQALDAFHCEESAVLNRPEKMCKINRRQPT